MSSQLSLKDSQLRPCKYKAGLCFREKKCTKKVLGICVKKKIVETKFYDMKKQAVRDQLLDARIVCSVDDM